MNVSIGYVARGRVKTSRRVAAYKRILAVKKSVTSVPRLYIKVYTYINQNRLYVLYF